MVAERESAGCGVRIRHQQTMAGKLIDAPDRQPRVSVDRIGLERMVTRQWVEPILEVKAAIAHDIRERRQRKACGPQRVDLAWGPAAQEVDIGNAPTDQRPAVCRRCLEPSVAGAEHDDAGLGPSERSIVAGRHASQPIIMYTCRQSDDRCDHEGAMRIVDVEALYLRMPEIDETRTDSSQDALLIRVRTDAGITGWGEVDGCPAVAKAIIEAPVSHTQVKGLRHMLLGEDPFQTEYLWKKLYEGTSYYGRAGAVIQAMAGIDLALWDIKGKALGKPIWALLGGKPGRLRAYSSNMFQLTVEATVERAKAAVDAGYTAVKFGWEPFGRAGIDLDLRYLAAIKRVTGESVEFMLDVGHAWDAKTAIQRCRRLRGLPARLDRGATPSRRLRRLCAFLQSGVAAHRSRSAKSARSTASSG